MSSLTSHFPVKFLCKL
uniref:Uncharacterized protein n=1 Tax=Anguilla anguilla TaxID=7936 RepID=A0A0E9UW71_ANGAN